MMERNRTRIGLVALTALILAAAPATAQGVLPRYNGIYLDPDLDIFSFIGTDAVELGFLRNEIYARYGRPFKTPAYRDYFLAQAWYREIPGYTDAWLSARDLELAQELLRLEKPAAPEPLYRSLLLRQGEFYMDDGMRIVLLNGREGMMVVDYGSSPYGGSYGGYYGGSYGSGGESGETITWTVAGDWLIFLRRYQGAEFLYATLPDPTTGSCGAVYLRIDDPELVRRLRL